MRKLEYQELPAMGPGSVTKKGSLKNLLFAIPYFLVPDELIPPLEVVNSVLRTGVSDAGMSGGCRWQPLEISAAEYEELVAALVTDGLKTVDSPGWVKTRDDWQIWVMQIRNSVPVEEHRRLTDEYNRLDHAQKEARARGDIELADDLFVQSVRAGNRLADFVMAHINQRKG